MRRTGQSNFRVLMSTLKFAFTSGSLPPGAVRCVIRALYQHLKYDARKKRYQVDYWEDPVSGAHRRCRGPFSPSSFSQRKKEGHHSILPKRPDAGLLPS